MNTKLTLRMEETLIEQVKVEAKKRGVSLSKLVSDYFTITTTITTIHYLISKHLNTAKAEQSIGLLMELFQIAPVTQAVLEATLTAGYRDFKKAQLAVYSPAALLAL